VSKDICVERAKLSMDSFKMIDEISLVEYSDEETADSEQLESFRKFCDEQNSEGVQESTPSASNTESAYVLLLLMC
jgi:hypothetical protein